MKTTFAMKMLALVVSLVMVLSLFACGEDTTTITDATATNAPTEEKTEAPTEEKTEAPTSEKTEAPGCTHEEVAIEGKAATCTEAGLTEGKKCAKCEEILVPQEEIPAMGHTEETLAAVAPTCQATGLTEGKKCSVCDAVLTAQTEVAIDPNAHNMDNGTPAEATRCGEKATITYKCQNDDCAHTIVVEGEALAHDMNEGTVTTAPTCTDKGVKTFECKREGCDHATTEEIDALGHTAGEPDSSDNCNIKCTVCGVTVEEGKHAATNIAAVWTPIVAPMDENGKIYEAKLCSDCGQAAEKRETYYLNCCDGFYVGSSVVKPRENNANQTEGFGGVKISSHNVYSDALVDKDGNTLNVIDSFRFGGWFAVNGGVARYVVKISTLENDGTWVTATGTPGTPNSENGIYKAIANNAELTDENAINNSNYQGRLSVPGLQSFADKTVTISFAAVPANNPGTDDAPNVIIIAVVENVYVTCDHSDHTDWVKTENEGEVSAVCNKCGDTLVEACKHSDCKLAATDDLLVYNAICNVCDVNVGAVSDINQEGLTMLTPDKINSMSTVTKVEATKTVLTDGVHNNMPYIHIEAFGASNGSEVYINIKNPNGKITGVGKYVAIVYRSVNASASEMFISSTESIASGQNVNTTANKNSTGWQHAVFDFSQKDNWSAETGIGAIRWDINNALAKGDYLDVAYVGFFNSKEAAESFYASYAEKYDLDYLYKTRINSIKVGSTKITTTTIDTVGRTNIYDFSGVTLEGTYLITLDSWFVAPNGVESYECRVNDGESVTVESGWIKTKDRTDLLNHMKAQAYYERGGFTDQCITNANTWGDINLTKYAGKTVTIDVVAHTKDGKDVVVIRLANITVPAGE